MFIKHLTLILRILWRFRLYSFLNIMGLAIALAVATLILLYVREELSYDRHFPKAGRIFRIANYNTTGARARNWANGAPLMAEEIVKFMPEIESVTRLRPIDESVLDYYQDSTNVISHIEKGGFFIDSTFLDIFDVGILHGNNVDPISKPGSLILTESLSRKFFGDEVPVGKSIYLQGMPLEITAICKDFPVQQHFHPAYFLNWQNFIDLVVAAGLSDVYYSRGWSGVYTYVLLEKNISAGELVDKLMEFRIDYLSEFSSREEVIEGGKFVLQSLRDIHLRSHLEQEIEANGNMIYVLVSSLAAIFILIIAGVNYLNLATVKAMKRMTEVGIRKVAGALQSQILFQFLIESLIMAFIAGLAAIFAMDLLLPLFTRVTEIQAQSLDLLSIQNTGILLGLVFLLAVTSGIYPSLFASRIVPIKAIKGLKDPGSFSNRIRFAPLTLQFTFSVFMILATITIYRQMNYFLKKDLGWDKENIMALTLNGQAYELAMLNPGLLRGEMNKLAFVQGVSMISHLPGDRFSVEGLRPDIQRKEDFDNPSMRFLRVDEDFIPMMGIRITEGRNLKHTQGKGSEFMLNEAAVRVLRLENPVGIKAETMLGQMGEIVGITENFHYASLQQDIEPLVLEVNYDAEFRGLWYHYMLFRLSQGDRNDQIKQIKYKMESLAKGYIMDYTFLEDNINKNYKSEKRLKELLRAFALLAVFISCLGLFGMSAFSAELKIKEMGIRKTMGASLAGIVLLMSRNFLVYVIIALLVSLPLGYYIMNKWLQNFAYHITIQWWEFILAGSLALTMVIISVGYQAIRLGTANPVDSLRYE